MSDAENTERRKGRINHRERKERREKSVRTFHHRGTKEHRGAPDFNHG